MKAKKLIPFLVILAILAALAVVQKNKQKPESIVTQVKLEELVPSDLKAKDIDRIELFAGAKPDEKVVLERADDAWRVATHFNAPVKQETLDTYVEKLLKRDAARIEGDAYGLGMSGPP